jgi:peroxiredoxin
MRHSLSILLLFAAFSFAQPGPRPTGDVPFAIPGKGADNLTNYKGKVVLLEFFMTDCPHCQRAVKVLNSIQRDMKAQVKVISLAFRTEDNAEALKNFAKQYQVNYTLGMIDPVLMTTFGQLTAEQHPTVPMVFIIDRNGIVQARYFATDPMMEEQHQEENLRAKLAFYIVRQPPAKVGRAAAGKK